ncbi:hypothetical protein HH212_02185 [Massilia forsythiae]|uniref:Uncharacterized protein n=1 Tax=Massilia forsythiae TaxID=2728020 RepID=A0A7Z2ZRC4_9BURK|nr:hypothetical protein [Massilia forsythiae]QJD98989.1 hypothetical protein HH212_02185 [Massilia forsythiae]
MSNYTMRPIDDVKAIEAACREWHFAAKTFYKHLREIEQGHLFPGEEFERLRSDLDVKRKRYLIMYNAPPKAA